jgi:hypothetical protein
MRSKNKKLGKKVMNIILKSDYHVAILQNFHAFVEAKSVVSTVASAICRLSQFKKSINS